jgi:hypothetical protein
MRIEKVNNNVYVDIEKEENIEKIYDEIKNSEIVKGVGNLVIDYDNEEYWHCQSVCISTYQNKISIETDIIMHYKNKNIGKRKLEKLGFRIDDIHEHMGEFHYHIYMEGVSEEQLRKLFKLINKL